jgi:hypothetical protein
MKYGKMRTVINLQIVYKSKKQINEKAMAAVVFLVWWVRLAAAKPDDVGYGEW